MTGFVCFGLSVTDVFLTLTFDVTNATFMGEFTSPVAQGRADLGRNITPER
jgi:hypothetical protein